MKYEDFHVSYDACTGIGKFYAAFPCDAGASMLQKEIAPSHSAMLCVGQLPVYTGGTGTVNNE